MEILTLEPLAGITESVEYLTSVIQCKAAESREALRETPRTELQLSFRIKSAEDFYNLKTFESRTGIGNFLLPYWLVFERITVAETDTEITLQNITEFVITPLKQLLLWKSASEVLLIEVAEIYVSGNILPLTIPISGFSGDCLVLPIYEAALSDKISFQKESGNIKSASVRVISTEIPQLESNVWETFENFKLLPYPGLLSDKQQTQIEWQTEIVDSDLGLLSKELMTEYQSRQQNLSVKSFSKSEGFSIKKAFNALKGRLTPFWIPSYNEDFKPPFTTNTVKLFIELTRKFYPDKTVKFFQLSGDSTIFVKGIFLDAATLPSNITVGAATVQILSLELLPANLNKIQELTLVKLSSDKLPFEWSNRENSKLSLNLSCEEVADLYDYKWQPPGLLIENLADLGFLTYKLTDTSQYFWHIRGAVAGVWQLNPTQYLEKISKTTYSRTTFDCTETLKDIIAVGENLYLFYDTKVELRDVSFNLINSVTIPTFDKAVYGEGFLYIIHGNNYYNGGWKRSLSKLSLDLTSLLTYDEGISLYFGAEKLTVYDNKLYCYGTTYLGGAVWGACYFSLPLAAFGTPQNPVFFYLNPGQNSLYSAFTKANFFEDKLIGYHPALQKVQCFSILTGQLLFTYPAKIISGGYMKFSVVGSYIYLTMDYETGQGGASIAKFDKVGNFLGILKIDSTEAHTAEVVLYSNDLFTVASTKLLNFQFL